MKTLVWLGIGVFLVACGGGPPPELDVQNLPASYGGKNPVAFLQTQVPSVCSAFLLKSGTVVTARHCVVTENRRKSETLRAGAVTLYFQNPSESEPTAVYVEKIRLTNTGVKMEWSDDWAVLEIQNKNEVVSRYGGYEIVKSVPMALPVQKNPGIEQYRPTVVNANGVAENNGVAPIDVDTVVYTPTQSDPSYPLGARLDYKRGHIVHVDQSYKIFKLDFGVTPGNSGSPVLADQKVIGILTATAYSGTFSLGQWVPPR